MLSSLGSIGSKGILYQYVALRTIQWVLEIKQQNFERKTNNDLAATEGNS